MYELQDWSNLDNPQLKYSKTSRLHNFNTVKPLIVNTLSKSVHIYEVLLNYNSHLGFQVIFRLLELALEVLSLGLESLQIAARIVTAVQSRLQILLLAT